MKAPDLPWQMRASARAVLDFPARLRNILSLRTIQRTANPAPVLSFGGVLQRREYIHGGAVKLLHLQEGFEVDEKCPNILYLVSSAVPPFVEDLALRMKSLGVPLVWNQNGVAFPGWAGDESERFNGPMRSLRSQAAHVVYQSAFCRQAADEFLGSWSGRSSVLINPVNLARFRPAYTPLPASPLRLLTLGTHGYADRVLSTIQCLYTLRRAGMQATLTIAGKMEWRNAAAEVQDLIRSLELESFIRVLPAFSQAEAIALYQEHHIVLHPKYLDPCPTVVLEALSCGLPVVGSATGGMPELVPSSAGVLIPAPLHWDRMITPTGLELAAAVQTIAPSLSDFSRAARVHAERSFSSEAWVESHRGIFQSLLK